MPMGLDLWRVLSLMSKIRIYIFSGEMVKCEYVTEDRCLQFDVYLFYFCDSIIDASKVASLLVNLYCY